MPSYDQGIALFIAVLLTVSPAYGQPVPASSDTMIIRLDALVREALEANPSLQASRAQTRAAFARPPQAGALPDPMATFTEMSDGTSVPFGNLGSEIFSWYGVSIEQGIPFPGKRALRSRYAQQEADAMEHQTETAVLQVAAQVKAAYYDLYRMDRSLEIIEKDRELLERFEQIARTQYTVGKGHQEAVLRAQLELSLLQERLIVLQQEREGIIAKLNTLRNRPPDDPLPGRTAPAQPVAFDYTLDALQQTARAQAPQLQTRQSLIDRETTGVQLARRAYYPDFSVMGTYLRRPRLTDMWEIKAGVTIPLYYWRKQRFGVTEARASLEAARQIYQAELQDLLFMIKDEYLKVRTAGRLIDLYGNVVVPQANLAVESALSGYQVGTLDFLRVLSDFTTLLDYELRYHEQVAAYHKTLATLEELTGLALLQR
jgi:outer membrane protein TolC